MLEQHWWWPCVCHKLILYWNRWIDRAAFWHIGFYRLTIHCILRKGNLGISKIRVLSSGLQLVLWHSFNCPEWIFSSEYAAVSVCATFVICYVYWWRWENCWKIVWAKIAGILVNCCWVVSGGKATSCKGFDESRETEKHGRVHMVQKGSMKT